MHISQPPGLETPTTILVVDDAAQLRDVVKRILGGCGYTVFEAKDGEACMRVFQEHSGKIHLLVTDMFMTGMNGRKVADHLLASRQNGGRETIGAGTVSASLRPFIANLSILISWQALACWTFVEPWREIDDEFRGIPDTSRTPMSILCQLGQ